MKGTLMSAVAKQPEMIYTVYHKGGSVMDVTVSRWGNSLGIRIPSGIAETLSIKDGDRVHCNLKGNEIILKKELSTKEIYESFYGKPFDGLTVKDLGPGGELDWGEDTGGEVIE